MYEGAAIGFINPQKCNQEVANKQLLIKLIRWITLFWISTKIEKLLWIMGTLNCKDVTKNFVHAHLYKMAMSDWVLVYMEYNT